MGIAKFIVVLTGSLELIHSTRLGQHAEAHSLLIAQLRALVLRHGVFDGAVGVDGQTLLTTGGIGVARSDEVALSVVGFHDHAGHGIVGAAASDSRYVDLADLEHLARSDDQLLLVLPRHRDRVTFDVLARPRVHDGRKGCAASLGGFRTVNVLLGVRALPGVAYRVSGSGFSELLDFCIGKYRVEIQVSLSGRSSNTEVLGGLVSDIVAKKSLTGPHRGNLSRIENRRQQP